MGRLIKAPEFDGVKGFHKEKNGLWEIGVKVLVGGIVLINFDSEREEHDKVLLEKEKTLKKCNVGETKKVGEFKIEGEFNWKLGGRFSQSHEGDITDHYISCSFHQCSRT